MRLHRRQDLKSHNERKVYMYKELVLNTQSGKKTFRFLATGTTAIRYRQIFHQDLLVTLNKMEDIKTREADTSVGDKLAYIMNAQAEKKDMNKLNADSFLEWADQFDGAELFLHMQDFITIYLGNKKTTSVPKKAVARRSVR